MKPELLRRIQFFAGLTNEELSEILKIAAIETYKKNGIIFEEGSIGDKCYLIIHGAVRISKFIPNIGEEALAVLKDGEYFGEMALIDNFPRSAHAIAEEETTLLTISKRRLKEFLYNHKDTAYKLLWTFCRTLSTRLRETNEKMSAFLAMTGKF